MISPCSPPLEPPIPPARTPASQTIVSPPSLPPNLPNLTLPSPPSSLQAPIPPPPPLPPLPAAMGVAPPLVFGLEKSQLLKEAFEKAGPVPRSRDDVKRLLKLHKDRFRSDLQWILFCADLPSLIQEGPQCGLVALWMAGALLAPHRNISLEGLVQMAVERGYSAQGEMFSVADMGKLAQEALGCHAELLCGGLGGPNRHRVLQHLVTGHPLLIPYDEDFNHEPCQRKGHKAHWAVSAGYRRQDLQCCSSASQTAWVQAQPSCVPTDPADLWNLGIEAAPTLEGCRGCSLSPGASQGSALAHSRLLPPRGPAGGAGCAMPRLCGRP
ncbi:actin maturation protease isoform X2 [Manis javanica]|uniref:actin maturation protease isoform X2 n=1 Tax=Manis javanica TaxID=9974 RepID=UPI003C6D8A44